MKANPTASLFRLLGTHYLTLDVSHRRRADQLAATNRSVARKRRKLDARRLPRA